MVKNQSIMKNPLVLFIILILICACAAKPNYQDYYNSFIGQSQHQILMQFGAPNRVVPDGNGGEILIYERARSVFVPVNGILVKRTIVDSEQFFCNSNKLVYHIKYGAR